MRIIAGEYRSRRLFTPPDDLVTRPIPDRVKESLFGLLRGNCENAQVFDCFAGTGAIGLETLSRGAARCVFVEQDRHAAKMLQANIDALGCQDRSELVLGDALGAGALARCPRPLDLAFFDPPYPLVRDPVGWARVRDQLVKVIALLAEGGFAILRLPHPFVHELDASGNAIPSSLAPPSKREGARGRNAGTPRPRRPEDEPFDWRRELERAKDSAKPSAAREEKVEAVEEDEPDNAPIDAAAPAAPETPGVSKVFPSLALAGSRGPETHVYHSTAIHLFMRAR